MVFFHTLPHALPVYLLKVLCAHTSSKLEWMLVTPHVTTQASLQPAKSSA